MQDIEQQDIREGLSIGYRAWVQSQGLTLASADELLYGATLTDYQRDWLRKFLELWEMTETVK